MIACDLVPTTIAWNLSSLCPGLALSETTLV